MQIKKYSIIAITMGIFYIGNSQTFKYPYQNPELDVETRVQDLLSRMSLEEKVRQMDMYKGESFIEGGKFSKTRSTKHVQKLGIGSIHDLYPKSAKTINDIQRFIIKNNRWGIPALVIEEMLHGYGGEGSTAFPMNIGLGATWDTKLMKQVGAVIGSEARAHGVHYGLGPVLGIGREPRWGRVAETFGEDAYLAGEIGLAMITGMQGDTLASNRSVIAEPKHFAVHSAPQAGGNSSPVIVGERTAREDFLPVFEKAYKKGGALGAMCAYSELDGIPCVANQWLLTDVLRNEWGFKGIVISDLGAIKYLQTTHFVSDSPKESIKQSVAAGVDMQFYDFTNTFWQQTLIDLVNENELSIEAINRAASGVLRLKFLLGLFENPYTDETLIAQRHNSDEHKALALESAEKSICLLKNEDHVLPINKNVKTVAVIGPNANASRLGGYAVSNKKGMTVLEGIKELVGENVTILYDKGAPVIAKGNVIPNSYLFSPDKIKHGLKGEYFNNRKLEGTPVLERIDESIEFDWPWSPGEGVNDDEFSIRWTGFLRLNESFEGWIGLSSDDGVRLWFDDKLIIDSWNRGISTVKTYPVKLEAGKDYNIRLEMWEGGGGARAHLRWDFEKIDFLPAIEKVKKADVAIVVLGESKDLIEENRDVANLDIQPVQLELLKKIQETGKPVVCVLLNGRPMSINWMSKHVPAIVEGWFPGELGGKAIANVLFGRYNPAGRLPISFPRSVGQLPIYYNQKPSAIHRYVSEEETPLFSFGHGLSYTTFLYNNLKMSTDTIKIKDNIRVSVDVTNSGMLDGEEVVQLYINDVYSSVTTPRKTLKNFKRILIKKGETKTIEFTLTPDDLSLWNKQMQRVVEPGLFEVMIGGNSVDLLKTNFRVVD